MGEQTLAKQALYHVSHISSLFYSGYFRDGGLVNYLSLLASISASQLARTCATAPDSQLQY
jgi:hypothetical protein